MLAVAGGKGGCGKTTTALALTRELAEIGREPLLVDADADMPDIHHHLNTERELGVPNSRSTTESGVSAVASGSPLSHVVRYPNALNGGAVLTAGTRKETITALQRCRPWSGPVIVDTPAGVSPDVTGPLRIADRALVVSTDESACLDDAKRTASVCSTLCSQSFGVLREVTNTGTQAIGTVPVISVLPTVPEPLRDETYATAIGEVASHLVACRRKTNPQINNR